MRTRLLLVPVIVAILAADTPKNELRKMEGIWNVASGERDGQQLPPLEIMNRQVVIQGNRYVVKELGKVIDQGVFTLDVTKSPRWIDVMPSMGPHAGKTLVGIYELKGNERTTCMAAPGKPRPTEFKTTPGSESVLIQYRREKAR